MTSANATTATVCIARRYPRWMAISRRLVAIWPLSERRSRDCGVDQMRSWLGDRGAELGREFFRRGGARCGNAEPLGDGDEVEVGIGQVKQGLRLRACRGGADSRQLELQDRVGVVVEDDD